MKISLRLTAVVVAALVAATTSPAQLLEKFNANGASASVVQDLSPYQWTMLDVARGGTAMQPETRLNFVLFRKYWDREVYVYTYGALIANGAFTGNGAHMKLQIDLGAAQVWATRCVYTYSDGQQTCEDLPVTATIDLTWKQTNTSSEETSGVTRQTLWPISIVRVGRSTSSSATVNGTVLGRVLADVAGSVGTNHAMQVTVEKAPGPPPPPIESPEFGVEP